MKRRTLLSLFKKQSGFTLIEFIVGIAIMGILGPGLLAATSTTISENVRSRSQMQAVQQVEIVGFWVTQDVQMSRTVVPNAVSANKFPLVLTWRDDAANTYQVTYSLSGTRFQRSFVKNGGTPEVSILADSINTGSTQTYCSYANGMLTIKVTSTVGKVTETRTYQIKNRPV